MSAAKAWWQQYGLTALLGTAAAAGVAAVGVETDWGRNVRATAAPQGSTNGATELTPTVPAFKLGELDLAFKDSGERPLFTPSRRPPPPVQTAAAPQLKRGQFKLAGTVVNADVSVAYLVELAGNKTLRVNKGAEVLGQPGLVVESVDASKVVLKLGDETEILELKTSASPPRPPAPPPTQTAATAQPPAGGIPAPGTPTTAVQFPFPPGVPPQAQVANVPRPTNSEQPNPRLSGIPGFVLPAQTPSAADPASQTDAASAAIRRRRFQNPQQTAPQ
jgi:hypothetical protein